MKGRDVRYRAAVFGAIFASLAISVPHMASAQQAGAFEQIPADQSPVNFTTQLDGQTAFLRQYRDNSTVFVGRWFAPRTPKEPQTAASDLYLETVYTTSAPGFRFSTAMVPDRLLDMFDALKDRTAINGKGFVQDTRYGPVALTPFVRQGSQCVAFVGQWDPQTQTQRGSRILGYYCTPGLVQAQAGVVSPQNALPMIDAQQFAAAFFGRLMIELPENSPATAEVAPSVDTDQPAGTTTPPPTDGIRITTNWQGVRGTGMLRFDQPSGEGTMILDDDQRHCEGIWRHEGGAYQTGTLPFGSWYVYCNDSSFARGHYTSESAATVTGDGQDNQGQAVYFRQAN
ncbi:hypothetical protein [Thalassospira povalilytica]|uniref:hypothetical protein n=1 Tax=Thalassospira povalilytica TaxID=732237 RepID=UPI001D187358|nr:hypothetical protein [Thalassospira povalilytica]MCC4242602.1 hypothetical protein [Thalassospira povalilytica]